MDWKQRATGIFDSVVANLLTYGVIALFGVVLGTIALAVIFLGGSVSVKGWELAVLAVWLVALTLSVIALAKAVRGMNARAGDTPAARPEAVQAARAQKPHRHRTSLNRIDSLDALLAEMQGDASARQAAGNTYNDLLAKAMASSPAVRVSALPQVQFRNAKWAEVDNNQVRVWLGQLRVLLEEDDERPGRRTDATFD